MLKLLKTILKYGVSVSLTRGINRSIFVTNITACILAGGFILLFVVHNLSQGFEPAMLVLLGTIGVCVAVPFLNKAGHYDLSRHLLSVCVVYSILVMTIFRKLDGVHYESTYLVSRAAIMVFAIAIPAALFHINEVKSISISVVLSGLALWLYDPIHNWAGAGYYQLGNTNSSYYYNNFFFLLLYVIMVMILGYLKMNLEKYEAKYEETIQMLSDRNRKIGKQKNELTQKNTLLIDVLNEKDQNLLTINQELVRQNNDLLQFSYAISHNVRGPVASIMGLMNLIEGDVTKNDELPVLMKHLSDGVQSLDSILHQLSQILAARDDTFNIKEEVNLKTELRIIEDTFANPIHDKRVKIEYDLKVEKLFTVRAYIHSILSQLISNCIQFRSLSRNPVIQVSSYLDGSAVIIQVEDNGLGINLERHGEDIFKPFKRFHLTASGKGIGLYLVKLQTEKLNGVAHIKSIEDVGSCITIRLGDDSKAI